MSVSTKYYAFKQRGNQIYQVSFLKRPHYYGNVNFWYNLEGEPQIEII